MKLKNIAIGILSIGMALTLAACGGETDEDAPATEMETEPAIEDPATEEPVEDPAEPVDPEEDPAEPGAEEEEAQ